MQEIKKNYGLILKGGNVGCGVGSWVLRFGVFVNRLLGRGRGGGV